MNKAVQRHETDSENDIRFHSGIRREVDRERGVRLWLDGGWAIDAPLGGQTRPLHDHDPAVESADRDLYEGAVLMGGTHQKCTGSVPA